MLLPKSPLPANTAPIDISAGLGNGDEHDREYYNSLIGIVTAICGNILISIALNTQRYAHIKLNEQQAERRRLLKRAERRRQTFHENNDRITRIKERQNGAQVSRKPQHMAEDEEVSSNEDDEQQPLLSSYVTNGSDQDQLAKGNNNNQEEASQKSYLKSPYWWAGIIMMTIGEAGNFLAYGFAPASIVSPLGVVAIISNCIIAPFFMKERFRWRDFFGVVIAVAGAVTVVLSASQNNPKLGPHEIWGLIATWEFETYFGITVAMIIGLMLTSNKYGDKSIFIDLGLVGLFGGYTALSTKGVASLLSYTLFQALTFPVTYLLVAILVGTAVMQIKYVNRALQRFEATQVIPTQFVLFTLSVILGSAVLYRDFEKTPGDAAGKFVGGCAMTFIGVWLITSARSPPSDNDDEEYDEDDEAINLREGEEYHDDIHVHINSSRGNLSNTLIDAFGESDRPSRPLSEVRSEVSIPESLERNHWESGVNTPRQSGIYGSIGSERTQPSPILENPWESTQDVKQTRSALSRFLEPLTSLLPTHTPEHLPSVLDARHSAPDLTLASESATSLIRTPRLQSQDTVLSATPSNPHLEQIIHSDRHSLSNIYPAPFTSPLSSSLSAYVADSLRRGVNFRRMRPRRPTRPRIPNMPYGSLPRDRGNSETGAGLLEPSSAHGSSTSTTPVRRTKSQDIRPGNLSDGRKRSLSNRFSELLRRSRKRPDDDTDRNHGADSVV